MFKGFRPRFHYVKTGDMYSLGLFCYWEVYGDEQRWGEVQFGFDLIFFSVGLLFEKSLTKEGKH